MSKLSSNVIRHILDGGTPTKPRVQVLSLKKITGSNSMDRWRLQISDGVSYQPCMVATQLNKMISGGDVDQYAIISLDKFVCNIVQGRKIIIIIQMSLVEPGYQVGNSLGNPVTLEMQRIDGGGANQGSAPAHGGMSAQGGAPAHGGTPAQGGGNIAPSTRVSNAPTMGGAPYSGSSGINKPYQSSTGSSYGANANQTGGPGWGNKPSTSFGGTGAVSTGGSYTNRPVVSAISPGREPHPISSLTPYQNKWTIRVRAVAKPTVRNYSNSRGEGKLMNVEFADKTGEIRATAFNEAADKFAPLIEANKVYFVSRARVKPANKQYSSVKNDYELFLQEDTIVEEDTAGASADLPHMSFNFTPIDQLSSLAKDTMVDVIGVCKTSSDVMSITMRTTSRKVSKRDIELVDMSGTVVSATVWAKEAEDFDGSSCPVVAIKGARVSDFGGCSLSLISSSSLLINPDCPEAHRLRGWFDNDGKTADTVSISGQRFGGGGAQASWLCASQVKELNLGHGEKPDYFSVKGFVAFFKKENCLYPACPKDDCNKKVTEIGGGNFHCEKCNQTSSNFKWRLMLQTCIADWSGSLWFTCFQDQAQSLLGRKAEEIGELKDNPDKMAQYDEIFSESTFGQFTFRLRAKVETYNDEQRLKVMCVDATPVDYSQNARRLIQEIKDMASQ